MRPFFFGLAVNDLLAGHYRGLILLSAVHFSWLVIGTIRHMYDTRTYTQIYTSLVTGFMEKKLKSTEISKLSAHSMLAKDFVDFLEYDFVYIIEAIYNLLGSMILLYVFYDKAVVGVCLAILLPVIAISHFYGRKMKRLTKQKNDELEKQVDVITAGDKQEVKSHYEKLRKWQVRISDQEAWNFGVMEILVMIVIGASLLVTKSSIGSTILAGSVIGIYNYILKFVSGLDTIPYTVQRLTSLIDIAERIESHSEEAIEIDSDHYEPRHSPHKKKF
jgi:ABC-type multidrug transport system fused ATPase/permease subunit